MDNVNTIPLYGLIGYPLKHSFSPEYFKRKFAGEHIHAQYQAFPLQHIHELPSLLHKHPNLKGLNVTIPHKKTIIPYLDRLHASAENAQAVNCIKIKNGITIGYNTDVYGFTQSLIPLLKPHHTHALILGTGGAAYAVGYALKKLHISFIYVSRKPSLGNISYVDITPEILQKYLLIIQTTPLGMYPDLHAAPQLPYEALTPAHLAYDLIYNPEETLFLQKAKKNGASSKNGLKMLHLQANASWEIWNDRENILTDFY